MEKARSNGYILYDSIYITFWKEKTKKRDQQLLVIIVVDNNKEDALGIFFSVMEQFCILTDHGSTNLFIH